jgi:hypothetical protein
MMKNKIYNFFNDPCMAMGCLMTGLFSELVVLLITGKDYWLIQPIVCFVGLIWAIYLNRNKFNKK